MFGAFTKWHRLSRAGRVYNMILGIGAIVVLCAVVVPFMAIGGHIGVLWQPGEYATIMGAAIGAFVIANNTDVLKGSIGGVKKAAKGPTYKKSDYLELMSVMYQVFRLAKTKGMLALEQHVEKPDESTIFQNFPRFLHDHHAVAFLCDYLRMMTLGAESPHEVETVMDAELEKHHESQHAVSHAIQTLADSMPALGIVAAVLGVIHTMGSINEPPEILGGLIGAALVGNFLGILLSYGFIGPIASKIANVDAVDSQYFQSMKAGILAHMQGYPPAVSVECARKALLPKYMPSFYEVEETLNTLPAP
jgi:chemotaxis protein MotA